MIPSLKKLEAILNSVADGISVMDANGTLVFVNEEAARLMGFSSRDEIMKLSRDKIMERYELLGEDNKPMDVSKLPTRRAIEGEKATSVVGFRMKSDEKIRWSQVKSTPFIDDDGKVEYVVSIFHEITEQKEAEKQVDFFLGMTGHELKTPLASMKALTQLMQRQFVKKGDVKTAGYMSQIDEKIDTLTNIINDLRDIAKIREGILEYRDEIFSAMEVVRNVIEDIGHINHSHRVDIEGSNDAYLMADKTRFRQVITNLLRNAIKYSPEADTVIVRVRVKGSTIQVEVEDFGIGVPADQHECIFDPFSRGTNASGSNIKGLGIGLYISREILRHYGGDLTLTSKTKGTIFIVSIPINKR